MLSADRLILISKLEMLNRYLSKDIEDVDKNIEHWKSRIEKFEEDFVPHPEINNETYRKALNRSIGNRQYLLRTLEQNNRLIKTLKEELDG